MTSPDLNTTQHLRILWDLLSLPSPEDFGAVLIHANKNAVSWPTQREMFIFCLLLFCLLCPSQPSLSRWHLKSQLQQRHSPHLIFLPHSHSQTVWSYHWWTKTCLFKTVTDCSRLLISVRDTDKTRSFLSDTQVQFWSQIFFQIRRHSASFSRWRQLVTAPDSDLIC